MSNLEKKWWFVAAVAALSVFCTQLLLSFAGLPSPDGAAQWLVHFFCLVGFWRCFAFLGWLLVLLVAPSSRLLERTRGSGAPVAERGEVSPRR